MCVGWSMFKQRLLIFSILVLILFYCANPAFISSSYAFSSESEKSKNSTAIIDMDLLKDMAELDESYIGNNSLMHYFMRQIKPEVMMSVVSYEYEERLNSLISSLEKTVLDSKSLRRDLNVNTNRFSCIRNNNDLACTSERIFLSYEDLILDFTQNEIHLNVEDKKITESIKLQGNLEQNNKTYGNQFTTDISIGCDNIYHYDNEKNIMEFEISKCYVGLGDLQLIFNIKAGLTSKDMPSGYIDILDIYYMIYHTSTKNNKRTETQDLLVDISGYFDSFSLQLKSKHGLLNDALSLVNDYLEYADLPRISKEEIQQNIISSMQESSFDKYNDEFSQLFQNEIDTLLYDIFLHDNQEVSLHIYPKDKPFLINLNDEVDFDYIVNQFFDYYNIKLRSDK